jgi:hypothetical protein
MKPGGGGRTAKLVDELKQKGMTDNQAKATAAKIGRAKYGSERFQDMAAKGRKRAARKRKSQHEG